ncbi:MAG: hypothetical protein ACI92B_000401 [Marinobacter maritimus]|jgi:hypothetical protein
MAAGATKKGYRHTIGQRQRVTLSNNRTTAGDITNASNRLTFNKDVGAVGHDGGGAVPFDRANVHIADAGGNEIAHGQSSFL